MESIKEWVGAKNCAIIDEFASTVIVYHEVHEYCAIPEDDLEMYIFMDLGGNISD